MNEEKKLTLKEKKIASIKQRQFNTISIIVAFVLGLSVGYLIWGYTPKEKVDKIGDIPIEGYPSIGPENAEIILIEFSDFGCSFCSKWHNETFQPLMDAYPEQILFVYRDVPFRAFSASEAAKCADEQGLFWEYHDKLFSYEYGLDEGAFVQYAEELGLDMNEFTTCMSEHRYKDTIQKDLDFASQLGINSTPTFYINGIKLIGAQPLAAFKEVIDEELAK